MRGGKLRALAVTSDRRWPTLTEVPTVAESGVAGYECTNWYAMFAPPKSSPETVNLIYREIANIANTPEIRTRLIADGQEPRGTTPEGTRMSISPAKYPNGQSLRKSPA